MTSGSSDERALPVGVDDLVREAEGLDEAVLEQEHAIAEALDLPELVADEDDRLPLLLEPLEGDQALLLEGLVADRQHLVEEEDVEGDLDRDRVGETHE